VLMAALEVIADPINKNTDDEQGQNANCHPR
jgi:hypothetical protein